MQAKLELKADLFQAYTCTYEKLRFLRPASMAIALHSQAVSTLSLQRSLIASSIALRMLRGSPCRLSFNLSALSDCISMFGKCNQKGFVTLKIEFDKTRSVLQLK
jgi:hypothetical protein